MSIEEQLKHMSAELGERDLPLQSVLDLLDAAAGEIAALKADLKAMTDFADLWYFVMDKQPRAFEKIVCEYTPTQWMHQAYLLKQRTKK